jgi:hypothetical protein
MVLVLAGYCLLKPEFEQHASTPSGSRLISTRPIQTRQTWSVISQSRMCFGAVIPTAFPGVAVRCSGRRR